MVTPALKLLGMVATVALALATAGCGNATDADEQAGPPPAPPRGAVLVAGAAFPDTLLARPDGDLLYAERLTGRIRRVSAAGRLAAEPIASVAVSTEGQRGLLGLAARGREIFAAWTRPDRRLVVAKVAPGRRRMVWEGPPSTQLANGGRLALAPDGRLVIGIGDLQDPALIDDPAAPNGKLLSLDPDGPPGQTPRVLSGGWNNPFGFAFTPSGSLWVADNAPGRRPERLARGDQGGPTDVHELEGRLAPSGLAAVSDRELLLCGFLSRRMARFQVHRDGSPAPAGDVASDCSLAVAVLADGRIAYSDERTIRVIQQ